MIYLSVPQEFANELVAMGAARAVPRPRGSILELAIVGATTAATCVSLLQGPEVVSRIAGALRKVAQKRKDRIEVRITGPGGTVHILNCTSDTPLDELGALVQRGLLGRPGSS